jgi:nicotinate dehydrogenase subunit B
MSLHQTISAQTGGPGLSRRGFLGASGGLVIAFTLFGPKAADAAAPAPGMPAGAGAGDLVPPPADKLYAWLAVNPDNTATLFTGKVETGTGVGTALAQIAAEELDFPLDRLDVVMGTTSQTVDQGPSYGSRTIRYAGPQIRQQPRPADRCCSVSRQHISTPRPTTC